jgi:hypothetical protein
MDLDNRQVAPFATNREDFDFADFHLSPLEMS